MNILKVLLIGGIISFALCSCAKEEILFGNHVLPVGETKIEMADLSAGLVYGYLENQNYDEFMAEFIVPDTLIAGIEEAISSGKEVVINYQAIGQGFVEDESGLFSEEHDLVPAKGNLEVSYFESVVD